MKSRHILILAALVLTAASTGRADFVLMGTEHMNVTTTHTTGVLFGASTADVLAGGYISNAYVNDDALLRVTRPSGSAVGTAWAHDTSDVEISGGSVSGFLYAYDASSVDISGGSVSCLDARETSSVGLSGGDVSHLHAYGASSVDISGGSVSADLRAHDTSGVAISGGDVSYLGAYETSSVDISGGNVSFLEACDTSSVDISGGSVSGLYAYDSSDITLHGYDFRPAGGLSLLGDEVIGTGVLTGKWFDDTSWVISIDGHSSGASIWAIPEPASAMLLGFGAMFLARRRKQGRQV